jgi:hypothetical protein
MKLKHGHQRLRGLTLMEVVLVIVVVVVLFVLSSFIMQRGMKERVFPCVRNLKECSLALLIWAGDNDEKFPFQVSTNQGGSMVGLLRNNGQ